MIRTSSRVLSLAVLALCVWLAAAGIVAATPDVYTGYDVSFTKPPGADYTLPQYQDQLSANVAFTRRSFEGLFNAVLETEYDFAGRTSPVDTEWATGWNNPSDTISASNWSSLSFTTWFNAYGGVGNLAGNITFYPAVVHLISEDIYFDLAFTGWSVSSGSGGGFAYDRSMLPPPVAPTTGDYNGNGLVDAADYTLWRDTFGQSVGTPGDGADGNLSGTIDEGDFTFWKERFGNVVSGTGAGQIAVAVPEPASLLLCLFGASLMLWRRRRGHAIVRLAG